MHYNRLIIAAIAVFASVITYGQTIYPLGLGDEKCSRIGNYSWPRMHVEDNTLYVCTNQGLYSKDLSVNDDVWHLTGFKDIPLQDYVRRGNDILALCYNTNGSVLLLSHDAGESYEDITPDLYKTSHRRNIITYLAQHPTDTNTLLASSYELGILQSADFGQTWSQLTYVLSGDFIGYHPLSPEIIYNSGTSIGFAPCLIISYNSGQTWKDSYPDYPGDNLMFHVAFHPTCQNWWIAGGLGAFYTTYDCGQTWETENFRGKNDVMGAVRWYLTTFDDEDTDIIYMAGCASDGNKTVHIACSTDSGKTWIIPENTIDTGGLNDFCQYRDRLFVYTGTDVYEIPKSDLQLQSSASIQDITLKIKSDCFPTFYNLNGQRIKAPQHGLNIVNGKKVIVK